MDGEIITPYPSFEEVDNNLLKRFDELVQVANPEDMSKLLESWAKYVSARKNNDVFTKEDPEEARRKNRASVAEEILRGKVAS